MVRKILLSLSINLTSDPAVLRFEQETSKSLVKCLNHPATISMLTSYHIKLILAGGLANITVSRLNLKYQLITQQTNEILTHCKHTHQATKLFNDIKKNQ